MPWTIYDHCAALTRIYSIFEIFYTSFSREICQILTKDSSAHSSLDEKTRTAYRKGIARILLEIHEKHYHRQLNVQDVSSMFSAAVTGTTPYTLLPDAFLVSKRALRLGELLSRLSDLGFDNVEAGLVFHPLIQQDIASENQKTATDALRKKLDDFIDARNDAAHQDVSSVWAHERIREAAYFIRDLCIAMLDLGEVFSITRSFNRGEFIPIGIVSGVYRQGKVIVMETTKESTITIGAEILIARQKKLMTSVVYGVQVSDVEKQSVAFTAGTEVGMKVGVKANLGDIVYSLRDQTVATTEILPFDVE